MTVSVLRLFLTVPWVGLQCVLVVFPGHTHLLYSVFYVFINEKLAVRLLYDTFLEPFCTNTIYFAGIVLIMAMYYAILDTSDLDNIFIMMFIPFIFLSNLENWRKKGKRTELNIRVCRESEPYIFCWHFH